LLGAVSPGLPRASTVRPLGIRNQQWHRCPLGFPLGAVGLFLRTEELARLGGPAEGRLKDAWDVLDHLVLDDHFADFLTLRAYAMLE